jgi:opacity protein-like surface antigen
MKTMKIAIASLIAIAAVSASAVEVGVFGTRDYAGTSRDGSGITVGTKVGGFGVTAGFERTITGTNDQNRISVVADRALTTVGPVALSAKVGVAHLNNQTSDNGYALTVGAGASMPLTKSVSATLDVAHQYGQDRVKSFDGNRVSVGLKYAF